MVGLGLSTLGIIGYLFSKGLRQLPRLLW